MTRSTLTRIIRYGITHGLLIGDESPVLLAAYVRGVLRGMAARRHGTFRSHSEAR